MRLNALLEVEIIPSFVDTFVALAILVLLLTIVKLGLLGYYGRLGSIYPLFFELFPALLPPTPWNESFLRVFNATVLRDGVFVTVPSTDIVVGDILYVQSGSEVRFC